MAPALGPVLTVGQKYTFQFNTNLLVTATLLGVTDEDDKLGRPGLLKVQRGDQVGYISIEALAVAWELAP